MRFSSLASTVAGDGEIFYGHINPMPGGKTELTVLIKFHADHRTGELFPNVTVREIAPTYRSLVERVYVNCVDRKITIPKLEYYDSENALIYLAVIDPEPIEPVENSPLGLVRRTACATLDSK